MSTTSYIVAQTFGRFLAAWVTRLRRRGRIRIVGHKRFLQAASGGRTLILSNHPSLLAETFLLGALAAPLYLKDSRRALWTMPDTRLLDSWGMPEWLRDDLHCIVADRRSPVKTAVPFRKRWRCSRQGARSSPTRSRSANRPIECAQSSISPKRTPFCRRRSLQPDPGAVFGRHDDAD